ncbi:MAG: DUF6089 family protein [Bacteroidota bacterium]
MRNLIIFLFLMLPFGMSAQHMEVGLFTGVSYYSGDISLSSNILKDANFSYGIFARYNISNYFGVKANVYRGRISASDANSNDENRRLRNLSFRNDITEIGLTAEFNILGYQPYALEKIFSPYIYAGIAGFFHNPQANYEDQWYNLQPLGTEGQGINGYPDLYKKFTMSVPFGAGVKVALNDKWNIGLDMGLRWTSFDYLDDLSTIYVNNDELLANSPHPNPDLVVALANRTGEYLGGEPVNYETGTSRGDDNNNDWYFMGGLTISYNFLDNGLVGSRNRGRKSKSGCNNKF